MRIYKRVLQCMLLLLVVASCSKKEEGYVPKPRGFQRIVLPEHVYQAFPDTGEFVNYPYRFELSKFSTIVPDTSFMTEPYWFELYYPNFKASIDISYKPVPNYDSLIGYTNTAGKLTFKHNVKATAIEESRTTTPNGDVAVMFELEGEVPSQFQFFVTDSSQHFFRAALYFPTATANDSLAPVIDYMKQDMIHMINTLKWKK
ncbi:gliding motility lipoprotein GldD [Limibacter armeniacum]|uniref:gliding motility lipoprotein GldD n=1 Tax=Limibacter armeniacum TaxID=466084 RepID=UPI002FE664CE